MIKCVNCGNDFEPEIVRKRINRRYSPGIYEEFSPDPDLCDECVDAIIRDELGITDEIFETCILGC